MRVTVLGKSPSWQDAGGACSGYLVQEGDFTLLLDCGNGVFSKLRRVRDYVDVDAVLISHLHADHFLDLVPFSYALTYAPRQQPVAGGRLARHRHPARPRPVRAERAPPSVPPVVGAWGNEDLIEQRLRRCTSTTARRARDRPLHGPLLRGPALHATFAVDLVERRRAVHLRRRLQPQRAARRVRARHRPAADRGDAAAARAHRDARPPHARPRPASTAAGPARGGSCSPTSPTSSTPSGRSARGQSRTFGGPVELAREGAVYTASERDGSRPTDRA